MWEWFGKLMRRAPLPDPSPAGRWDRAEAQAAADAALGRLRALSLPVCSLQVDDARPVGGDAHSSLAGPASLPPDLDWPVDARGWPLIFLAQLNFSDLPHLPDFPRSGVLAFFIGDDDLYGCDFSTTPQPGYRVLYFEDPTVLERRTRPEVDEAASPIWGAKAAIGMRLTGTAGQMAPAEFSHQGLAETAGWLDAGMPPDIWESFGDALVADTPDAMHFGGHPVFTQDDPRHDPAARAFDRVLLRLGYVYGPDFQMVWGDAGEAVFLLSADDLRARRFERAFFSWDCS